MKGSCLCGQVQYEVDGPIKVFQYCHCQRCRKVTGTAFAANMFAAPEQFRWLEGEALLGRFEHPEAKYYATSFCTQCGSTMPWLIQGGKNMVITAGTLDDDPGIRPQQNIFTGSKACWFEDTGSLTSFAGFPTKG